MSSKIPVKKISIQIKIGLLMILAVVLLSAPAIYHISNLSSIVASIQVDLRPDPQAVKHQRDFNGPGKGPKQHPYLFKHS